MYHKAYGIIETLAPLHVGASAGEETGNLNLIFRDQFTQTGIIPGSSIRGRFRADMRSKRQQWLQKQFEANDISQNNDEIDWKTAEREWLNYLREQLKIQGIEIPKKNSEIDWKAVRRKAKTLNLDVPDPIDENHWYGYEAQSGQEDGGTTEANAKFEYASLVWLPVFCPGQPIVWVTCPWLLRRHKQIAGLTEPIPQPYTAAKSLQGRQVETNRKVLFFNLGFLEIEYEADLSPWIPIGTDLKPDNLVVVDNNDIAMLHDMGLYRQSRVKLLDDMKKVDTEKGAFFNVEALPEASILVFPIALKQTGWKPFGDEPSQELYFGGLESIGFGRCRVTLSGEY